MRRYLSYGGGVNSTALLLWLLDRGEEFEAVFVDHGGDYPETYRFISQYVTPLCRKAGIEFTTILTPLSLYGYAEQYNMLPTRHHRWCTRVFKTVPFNQHVEKPCVVYMGIHAGEERRAIPANVTGITKEYPLVEHGIDQAGCERIIREHGLPVPPKSGCYFCPFARVRQVRDLAKRGDGLFCKVQALEDRNIQARRENGKKPLYLYDRPLQQVIDPGYSPDQETLWEEARPCQCGL